MRNLMMKNKSYLLLFSIAVSSSSFAGMADDPVLIKTMIDRFEVQVDDGPDPAVLEAQLWIGKDLNKLWLKADVEHVDGETEEAEIQALYSRAISPYWDIQLGFRRDARPEPERDWLTLGLEGLAPYWFEVNAALFAGEDNRFAARLEAEYEWMLTQRWVLSPEIALNAYSKDIPDIGVKSGVSDMELGLRLRYELRREFAPYIGVNWNSALGGTANLLEEEGEETSEALFVAGIRAWF